ncbi:MAG: metallophosphoesterase family protein [Acidobacteriota bacterium]
MRIAVIADIHGNVPALEAVLDHLVGRAVDEVLVGGDLVGRGPEGGRVVQRIGELGFPTIGGNHEEYLLDFRHGRVPAEWDTAEEWDAARWMAAELSDDDVRAIESLPFSLNRPGMRLVHGTPSSNRDGIGPWTGDALLRRHWDEVPETLLVCAHTHRPLVRRVPNGLVVNVGSVGLPFNGDHAAQYAIFERPSDAPEGAWKVEPQRVPYDLGRTFAAYERTGFLAAGGITARLLRHELEHATPLLVPFLEWARRRGVTPASDRLDEFFTFHRPGESLRHFFERLHALEGQVQSPRTGPASGDP